MLPILLVQIRKQRFRELKRPGSHSWSVSELDYNPGEFASRILAVSFCLDNTRQYIRVRGCSYAGSVLLEHSRRAPSRGLLFFSGFFPPGPHRYLLSPLSAPLQRHFLRPMQALAPPTRKPSLLPCTAFHVSLTSVNLLTPSVTYLLLLRYYRLFLNRRKVPLGQLSCFLN